MPRGSSDVLNTHPAIWVLFRASDGERSMAYDGARIRCGRDDCAGFTDELECPKGCGVRIESNQDERDERFRQKMAEQEAERKRWRAEMKAEREARALGQMHVHPTGLGPRGGSSNNLAENLDQEQRDD